MKGFEADLTRLTVLLANPVMEKFVDALRLYDSAIYCEMILREVLNSLLLLFYCALVLLA